MAEELHKCLINYYSQLKKVDRKWQDLCIEVKPPLGVLKNILEQLQLLKNKEVDDVELLQMGNLRERVIFKILMGIDSELTLILDALLQFNNTIKELKNRLKKLEFARNGVSLNEETMEQLINGTSYRPKLNLLLEWAIDSFNYYHERYILISKNIKDFGCKNEQVYENLEKSFVEDRFQRAKITRILDFTQFLVQDTIQ